MIALIPDIHLRHNQVDKILKWEEPDYSIFLGDHFDQFNDSADQNRKAAMWIKARQQTHPKDQWIWGNHDVSYAYDSFYTRCSGYTADKDLAINAILTRENWDKFQWYTLLGNNTLVSHAGLHEYFASRKKEEDSVVDWLKHEAKIATMSISAGGSHWMYRAGQARGGSQPFGGINWLDWNDEFNPIPGINQVVGHTVVHRPGYKESAEGCWNHNLDTNSQHYGLWNGNSVVVKYAPDEISGWNTK